jgi:3-hydroxybutyryl-CoA dehydrogenase
MFDVLGDPRYRPSPWLARRAQLGMSLTQSDAADIQTENPETQQ